MRINNIQNSNISFDSHLTKDFLNIIKNTNPKDIESQLAKLGVEANLGESKAIAACTMQTVKIFNALKLSLPQKIEALCISPINKQTINGIANPNMSVKFNKEVLDNIVLFDKLNTTGRKEKLASTEHFLSTFLHEFLHIENFSMMKKSGNNFMKLFKKINGLTPGMDIDDYVFKNYKFYPKRNFFEIFADVMSNKIAKNLDNNLLPKNSFSTIMTDNLGTDLPNKVNKFNKIIKNIYIGDIKALEKAHL